MKRSEKYPAPDDGGASLPHPSKVAGLHPLVWVFIVAMAIAAFAAFDHLEDAHWGRAPLSEENHSDVSKTEESHPGVESER